MILTPTIVNDGRRMVISSQPVSYLTTNTTPQGDKVEPTYEDVEFTRLFERHNPMNLRYTSALRMNATFPYVLPMVSLPTNPPIDVMDAGLRDNFGIKTTLQFLYTFRNWINTNTSGVVVIQVRDIQKNFESSTKKLTLVNKFTAPLGSMYGNFTKMQDYNSDQMMRYLSTWFDSEINVVDFQLYQTEESEISLSWHLTEAEKQKIKNAVHSTQFAQSLNDLQKLLANQTPEQLISVNEHDVDKEIPKLTFASEEPRPKW
ncbi:MAG: hypothetical protein HKN32_08090 [Flavobacteriales bacterium]|nr:hypothetical protein [Flavobacteriales bacterium]